MKPAPLTRSMTAEVVDDASVSAMISLLSYRSRVRERRRRLVVLALIVLALAGAMIGGWLAVPTTSTVSGGQAMAASAPIQREEPDSKGIVLQGMPTETDEKPAKPQAADPVIKAPNLKIEVKPSPLSEKKAAQSVEVSSSGAVVEPAKPDLPLPAKVESPKPDTLLQQADMQRRAGNLGRALQLYQAVLDTDPSNPTAMAGKLAALNDGTQYGAAAAAGGEWLQTHKAHPAVMAEYAKALSRLSDADAGQSLERLVAEHPNFAPAAAALREWQARYGTP